MSDTALAGWYPDPNDPALEWWWNGVEYTQRRRVGETTSVPVGSAASGAADAVAADAVASEVEVYTPEPTAQPDVAPPAYQQPTYQQPTYQQPAYAYQQPTTVYPAGAVSPKSRTVASILGFFLGGLGVDRFYLGCIGLGVTKLLFGWLTLGIWPLIDWIVILAGGAKDGQGLPVRNWG